MWKWLKKLVVPDLGIQPEPLSVNPTKSEREVRNCDRCNRLRAAIADGDTRQSVKDELERRERWGR